MPRQYQMTFVSARKGWMKYHKGKTYAVSCAQLGAPPSKEASYLAANAWWDSKQKELESAQKAKQAKVHPRSDAIVEALERHTGLTFQNGEEATQTLWATLLRSQGDLPNDLYEAVLGPEKFKRIVDGVGALAGGTVAVEGERTISYQVCRWLETLQANVNTGLMSAGRWDGYSRTVKHFTSWIGEYCDVATVTALKLEAYYGWVSSQVVEGKWTPATANGVFMTARQFIRWMADLGLIPLPGNIGSRRFRFGNGATSIETFTDEEIKTLLTHATERTKLYLLLMLNCGMYQNDIAELAVEEVNWKAGTITRKRSKTRNRKDAPTVCYRLWPETLRLLKVHRVKTAVSNDTGGTRLLLTSDNKPLVHSAVKNGKHTGYDAIQSAYFRLQEKSGVKKALKSLRKTSASKLASHPEYGAYVQHFLAHAPKGMTDRHYVKPDQEKFDEAMEWLRGQFGL